jgi:phosphoesterase RecJ-like protein
VKFSQSFCLSFGGLCLLKFANFGSFDRLEGAFLFDEILKLIQDAKKIALFTHLRPDGDALGSSYALKLGICSLGKICEVFLEEPCSSREYSLICKGEDYSDLRIEDCDLKISLDSADIRRLGKLKDMFSGNTATFDHHLSHNKFANIAYVDGHASSTGEIIYEFLTFANIPITKDIANNLYVSISSDTGCFKFSCTGPKTHRIAAKLIEIGVPATKINKVLFDTTSFAFLNLTCLAIEKLKMFENGKIAVLYLTEDDFKSCKINEETTDSLVYLLRNIEGVEVCAYMRRKSGELKVSLRSNDYVNVTNVAKNFGGGGHKRAAGFSIPDATPETRTKILGLLIEEVQSSVDGK